MSLWYIFCLSNRLNIYEYLKIIDKELQYKSTMNSC